MIYTLLEKSMLLLVFRERGRTWLLIHTDASLDRYQRGHERGQQHLLRCPDSIYGDTITLSKGLAPADPLYLAERDYQTYYVGSRHEQLFRVFPCSYSLGFLQATMLLHLWTHICHLQGEKTWPQVPTLLLD